MTGNAETLPGQVRIGSQRAMEPNAIIPMSLSGSPEQWREAQAKVAKLMPRQLEVLTLIAEGLSQNGIARSLEISPRTTEVHRGQMMMKIGARTPGDAARIAVYAALAERLGDDEPGARTPRVP